MRESIDADDVDAMMKNHDDYDDDYGDDDYDECYDFETFFCNVTKKRNSNNPIYKTCDPLDEKELRRFCDYVKKII